MTATVGTGFQRRTVTIPQGAVNSPDPFKIPLAADFPQFTDTLDRKLRGQGNLLDGCSGRLLWIGETSIRDGGESLALSSKLRYEQWLCTGIGDTRLLRDTRVVQWRISVEPAPLDELRLVALVENVEGLNNQLEEALGLRVREEVDIPFPSDCGRCECSEVADMLDATLESTRFRSTDDGGVRVEAIFSGTGDLTDVLGCLQ
ncbi:MAG: hypothetical protein OXN89_04650 [Bryobacterales bacterium]|nr:hypothetical protein [Bryobacterales bacterium]